MNPVVVRAGAGWTRVCGGGDLLDGGDGVRFEVADDQGSVPAFAVRSESVVRAYLNRCRHVAVELDWSPGKFFDETGLYLICATHGATYRASDGACAGGPCRGGLVALPVREADGEVLVELKTQD